MDWNLVSFVVSSNLRFKVLIELNKGKKIPTELAKITKKSISHVSTSLRELEEKNLVQCLTPERRKGKYYEITDSGRQILNFISKETKISTSQE